MASKPKEAGGGCSTLGHLTQAEASLALLRSRCQGMAVGPVRLSLGHLPGDLGQGATGGLLRLSWCHVSSDVCQGVAAGSLRLLWVHVPVTCVRALPLGFQVSVSHLCLVTWARGNLCLGFAAQPLRRFRAHVLGTCVRELPWAWRAVVGSPPCDLCRGGLPLGFSGIPGVTCTW